MKLAGEAQAELIKIAAIGLGVVVVGWLGYRAVTGAIGGVKAAGEAVVGVVADAVPYVNPADSRNVAYSTVNKVGAAITGNDSDSWSLGGWIYDITH